MSFSDDMADAIDDLAELSPCVLVHGSSTYSDAFKAFDRGEADMILPGGYQEQETDVSVFVKVSSIKSTAPAARDLVTLDGVSYRVVNNGVRSNAAFVRIDLAKIET